MVSFKQKKKQIGITYELDENEGCVIIDINDFRITVLHNGQILLDNKCGSIAVQPFDREKLLLIEGP